MIWLFKFIIITSAWLLLYQWLLRKQSLLWTNRLILIAGLVCPFLMAGFVFPAEASSVAAVELPGVVLHDVSENMIQENPVNIFSFFLYAWIAGSVFFLVRYLYKTFKGYKLISKNAVNIRENIYDWPGTDAFSFAGKIYIPAETPLAERNIIIVHEQAHTGAFHGIDLAMADLYRCLTWFLPFAFFFRKFIHENHEFYADRKTLSVIQPDSYARLLLQYGTRNTGVLPGNYFHQSTIKNRIKMMYAKSNSVTPVFLLSGFFLLLFSSFLMISCSPETPENAGKASANVTQPEFPGGTEALIGFMQSNLQYPETARANGTSGKVVVSFMIDENGKVKDAKVVTAVDPALDAEALRLIAAMPDWKPAAKDGKNISTTMSLPVNFALNF